MPVSGGAVTAFHAEATRAFFTEGSLVAPPETTPLWLALSDNHRNNMQLWAEEDLARRKHVPDAAIAANKRAIDRFNQARNDAVERMDEVLESLVASRDLTQARLNSETPGSIIDRLSIASLKIFHMAVQVERQDVDDDHRASCADKLARLRVQRTDLSACLDALLTECRRGQARFRTYRQFKMYNDPRLNMALVQEAEQASPTG